MNLSRMLLLIFMCGGAINGLTFEEVVADLCYVDSETMTKFLDCIMDSFPEKFRASAQNTFDMFNGMTKTEAVLLMCKAAMDAASALFDDFVTMYAGTAKEREHLKEVIVLCFENAQ